MRKIATTKPRIDTVKELKAIMTINDSYILRGITPSIDETWGLADTLFNWQKSLSNINYSMSLRRKRQAFWTKHELKQRTLIAI
ncbi:hypothetical protein HLI_03620 [Halobacillus litoralis]|uniref:Uncharacterized protein n=1 Tax=Halobacillus litoralis TaxID=45668 RepID=A0A410M9K3_9BACI|nr:hypothetical protein HLI_03620 [Halobacillus litoralis]